MGSCDHQVAWSDFIGAMTRMIVKLTPDEVVPCARCHEAIVIERGNQVPAWGVRFDPRADLLPRVVT